MSHDARGVANAILDLADQAGIEVTPLKLQKLIYFAHGHSLRTRGHELVFNSFLAWDHGPVVQVAYKQFSDLRHRKIDRRARWKNFATSNFEIACAQLSVEEMTCLSDAMSIYGPVDAYTLSKMSHAPNGPWSIVRSAPGRYPDRLISKELIAQYFSEVIWSLHRQ
jgi:uncharacterized phage-associated protein